MNSNKIPRARPLEAVPFVDGEEHYVMLRDPYRFQPDVITLPVPAYLLLSLFNGERTVEEIRQEFKEQFHSPISQEQVEHFAAELDELGLLFSERFETLRHETLREFHQNPFRPAAHAGAAYELQPVALREQLDGFRQAMLEKLRANAAAAKPSGASKLILNSFLDDPEDHERQAANRFAVPGGASVQGLIVPHIDPHVGGCTSAYALEALKNNPPAPDLFVIFGTAHQPGHNLFTLTEKSFQTPLGHVETDLEVARALREAYPFDLEGDEYLHKHEHSIEFPVLYLQGLYRDQPFKILPVLVGSFYEFLHTGEKPDSDENFAAFPNALKKVLAASGHRRVCFVSGADFSHIGVKFGDEVDLSDELLEDARRDDMTMISMLEQGDPAPFFDFLKESGDKQKVCGLPPIYTMLRCMPPDCTGRLLDYDLKVEPPTQSFVTFASMVFYGKGE